VATVVVVNFADTAATDAAADWETSAEIDSANSFVSAESRPQRPFDFDAASYLNWHAEDAIAAVVVVAVVVAVVVVADAAWTGHYSRLHLHFDDVEFGFENLSYYKKYEDHRR
jgi:hypothetical protein